MSDLTARRAVALRALAQRPAEPPPGRFPGETPPSGPIPDNPEQAAQYFHARHHGLPFPEDTQ